MVSKIVDKFKSIETLLCDLNLGLGKVVEYYKEFNKKSNYRNDVSLMMLTYFIKNGDDIIKVLEFRKRQPNKQLP
jgi:hypothetical protein